MGRLRHQLGLRIASKSHSDLMAEKLDLQHLADGIGRRFNLSRQGLNTRPILQVCRALQADTYADAIHI